MGTENQVPARACPKCGSSDYAFRGRKRVAADPAKGEASAVETKYRCKSCSHEWRVRGQAPAAGS
jgi:hypothetical protein